MRIKTTPINCVSGACALVEAFDDAVGGLDPVVDSITDMAKASLAALIAAAQVSERTSMAERGRAVEIELEGFMEACDRPWMRELNAISNAADRDGEAVTK
ncbi:MAG: hypothetical protein U0M51_01970 [Eggerthellaceae bacterium]